MKIKNIILFLIVLIICIYWIFKRFININLMFLFYDIYALFGMYWIFEPSYCSNMKSGFTPVMPIEYYAEFNKAIFPRISSGDNNLNKEQIKKICDRNLKWLQTNGNTYNKVKEIDI